MTFSQDIHAKKDLIQIRFSQNYRHVCQTDLYFSRSKALRQDKRLHV